MLFSIERCNLRGPRKLLAAGIVCLVLGSSTVLLGQVKNTREYKYKVPPVSMDAAYVGTIPSSPAPKDSQLLGPGGLASGFEAAEGFAPGPIGGQAGWTMFAASTTEGHVDTVNAALGAQHLRISLDAAAGSGTFTGAFSPDLGMLPSGASTTSVDISIGAAGGADYLVVAQSPAEGSITWQVRFSWLGTILILDDIDGFGFAEVDTGVVWTEGSYVNLTVCDNPIGGTTDYFYGGALIYSQVTHVTGTRVEQIVLLSDNFQAGESGDFDNLDLTTGLAAACSAGSTCGNNIAEAGEACDGTDDAACAGLCLADCTCPAPVCGNGILEAGEACDGAADAACPGLCIASGAADECTCAAPPAPANDDCANSVEVFTGTTAFDTSSATTDGPAHPGHASCDAFGFDQLSEDIWYHHFATCDGDLTVTLCEELGGAADFDTRIAVYAPGCPATDLSLTDCNDDDPFNPCGTGAGGFHSTLVVPVTSGQELLIRVGGFSASGQGLLNVVCSAPPVCGNNATEGGEECDGTDDAACPGQCIAAGMAGECTCAAPPAPANDDCANSAEIFVGTTVVDTTLATTDGPAHPGHASCDAFGFDQVSEDIWFHHFATCTGDLTVTMCEELGGAADFDTRIAAYAPGCPATDLSLTDCNDDDPFNPCGTGAGGFHSTLVISVTSGQEVLIRVGGFAASGQGIVNVTCGAPPVCGNDTTEGAEECDGTDDAACPGLCIAAGAAGECTCGSPPGPANDDCASSSEIFVGVTAIDTTLATTDGPAHPGHASCDAFGFNQLSEDIWYHHFATCTGDLTVTMCEELGGGADFDTRLAVYAPGCPATDGSMIDCNDDDPVNPCGTGAGGFHSTLVLAVTSGQEVLVRVGGFADSGTGSLNVTCSGAPPSDCGNNVIQLGEECDGTNDSACPGECIAPGLPNECTCPTPGGAIPAVSEWGILIMALFGMIVGTALFGRMRKFAI